MNVTLIWEVIWTADPTCCSLLKLLWLLLSLSFEQTWVLYGRWCLGVASNFLSIAVLEPDKGLGANTSSSTCIWFDRWFNCPLFHGHKALTFFFFFFFFFLSLSQHSEVPWPGIKSVPQQQPKPLQWQGWILNPLCHQGNSSTYIFAFTSTIIKKKNPLTFIKRNEALPLHSHFLFFFFGLLSFLGLHRGIWRFPG